MVALNPTAAEVDLGKLAVGYGRITRMKPA